MIFKTFENMKIQHFRTCSFPDKILKVCLLKERINKINSSKKLQNDPYSVQLRNDGAVFVKFWKN